MIEKKTQVAMQAQQERNRMNTELTEIKDHMDIKDRKINVLQRKVSPSSPFPRRGARRRGLLLLERERGDFVYAFIYLRPSCRDSTVLAPGLVAPYFLLFISLIHSVPTRGGRYRARGDTRRGESSHRDS